MDGALMLHGRIAGEDRHTSFDRGVGNPHCTKGGMLVGHPDLPVILKRHEIGPVGQIRLADGSTREHSSQERGLRESCTVADVLDGAEVRCTVWNPTGPEPCLPGSHPAVCVRETRSEGMGREALMVVHYLFFCKTCQA